MVAAMSASLLFGPEPACADDLPAIAALHGASWRSAYRGILPEAALGAPLDAWLSEKSGTDELDRARVVVIRGEAGLCGFASFRPRDGGVFLDNLHVAPRYVGKGLGRRLMAVVAAAAGSGPLSLEVLEANLPARAIYRAWGGSEGAVFEDRLLDLPVPARMVAWPDATRLAARLAR
jgi:GNAT superfamily N-acetyltransferase